MSNLKILGAQRVKALTAMLEEQEKEKLAELRTSELLSHSDTTKIVDAEFNVSEIREELDKLEERVEELSQKLKAKIGKTVQFRYDHVWNDPSYNRYTKRHSLVQKGDFDKKSAALAKEYAAKRQRLWLCETLEEAKAIVGI
jgi:uncharacterized protein YceH (UPF0502 family)